MSNQVEGIVLAAGLSRRMGRQKLLERVGGQTLISRVVGSAIGSHLNSVTIVTGPRADDLLAELDVQAGFTTFNHVVNPHPELGMSSSLRIGIMSVSEQAMAAMIILADQAGLSYDVINELVLAYQCNLDRIIVPTINNRRTTPVIFPRSLFAELAEVSGDVGGRTVVNSHPDLIVSMEMASRYYDADVDTPDDLQTFIREMHVKNGKER
jgi:molybdenum cofactor cytidylyltransferase